MTSSAAKATCYLCHCAEAEILADKVSDAPKSKIYRCNACRLTYLFPIMTPEEEHTFYQSEFERYMEGRSGPGWKSPEAHFYSYQAEGERRLPLARPHLKRDDEVLEIGSSTGYFLDDLKGYTKTVRGVEPSPAYRDYANQRGIQTAATLAELKGQTFDVICFYYVLEHLRDPIDYLKTMKSYLKKGGRLILEVPNVDDALLTTYPIPNFAPFYWQKMHYFNFSQISLADVLKKANYEARIFPVQRYDLSNHLVWMAEGKPGGAGRYKELFSATLESAYAEALKNQWRCDTVMAVATAL